MKLKTRPRPQTKADLQLRFDYPLHCDEAQLDRALEAYSDGDRSVKLKLAAPITEYEACHKVLEAHPEYETVGEYLLATVHAVDPAGDRVLFPAHPSADEAQQGTQATGVFAGQG